MANSFPLDVLDNISRHLNRQDRFSMIRASKSWLCTLLSSKKFWGTGRGIWGWEELLETEQSVQRLQQWLDSRPSIRFTVLEGAYDSIQTMCEQLVTLSPTAFREIERITVNLNSAVTPFFSVFPMLRFLDIRTSDAGIIFSSTLLTVPTLLENLVLRSLEIEGDFPLYLPTSLRKLHILDRCRLDWEGCSWLSMSRLMQLTALSFENVAGFRLPDHDKALHALHSGVAELQSLKSLHMVGGDLLLDKIGRLTNLTYLGIWRSYNHGTMLEEPLFIKNLNALSRLQKISLQFESEELEALEEKPRVHMPALRSLRLRNSLFMNLEVVSIATALILNDIPPPLSLVSYDAFTQRLDLLLFLNPKCTHVTLQFGPRAHISTAANTAAIARLMGAIGKRDNVTFVLQELNS